MKTVKFYWELKMTDDVFAGKGIQELISEIKSGKFQREMEKGDFNTGGKLIKCIATVKIE